MKDNKKDILTKYLQGCCSPDEKIKAIEWIKANDEEFVVKAAMAEILNKPDRSILPEDQIKRSRKKIFAAISKNVQEKREKKVKRIIVKISAIAASWLLFFGFGYGLQQYFIHKAEVDTGFYTIAAPAGSRSEVTLPDGSKVWLNAGSQIKFSKNFETDKREIQLAGEAYFDVMKKENMPFVVQTHEIKINVLGTAFNVRAYPGEKFVEATVERGLVTVERQVDGTSRGRKVVLKHNQQARFDNVRPIDLPTAEMDSKAEAMVSPELGKTQGKIYVDEKVETAKFTSWIENILVFDSEPLESLTKTLERRHSVSIEILDENLKNRQYTGIFEKENIEQALKALQYAGKFYYSIDKDKIFIDSKTIPSNHKKANKIIVKADS
jgi:transmembrane sensor